MILLNLSTHFSFSWLHGIWDLISQARDQTLLFWCCNSWKKKTGKKQTKKKLTKQQCSHFFSSVTLEGEVLMCPCRLWWPGQQSTLRQPCWACSSRVVLIRLSVSPFSIFVFHQKLMFSNNQLSTESFFLIFFATLTCQGWD